MRRQGAAAAAAARHSRHSVSLVVRLVPGARWPVQRPAWVSDSSSNPSDDWRA